MITASKVVAPALFLVQSDMMCGTWSHGSTGSGGKASDGLRISDKDIESCNRCHGDKTPNVHKRQGWPLATLFFMESQRTKRLPYEN